MLILTFAAFSCIFACLVKLTWTDHKYYLLPNSYNLLLLLSFAAFHFLTGWVYVTPLNAAAGLLAGGAFLLIVRAVANRAMKADTVGLGDVKFMMAAGFGLGIPDVFLVLSLGSLIGLLHGGILYRLERRRTGRPVSLARVNVPAGVGFCIAAGILTAFRFNGWWEGFLS